MSANRPIKKIKKGDLVQITHGAHKGKTGKVLSVQPKRGAVTVEGVGVVNRHIKPNQVNPRGGTKEIHVPIDVSKVAVVVDEKKGTTSRIGLSQKADGSKTRIARALKDKEIA